MTSDTTTKPPESGISFSEWALAELTKIRHEKITVQKMRSFLEAVLEWAKLGAVPLDEMESQLFDAFFDAGIPMGEMPTLEKRHDGIFGELDIGAFREKISATC